MGMSLGYGPFDDQQSIRVIQHAVHQGVTLLDTSDIYGNGHNEILIQKALAGGLREKVILATKCGFVVFYLHITVIQRLLLKMISDDYYPNLMESV